MRLSRRLGRAKGMPALIGLFVSAANASPKQSAATRKETMPGKAVPIRGSEAFSFMVRLHDSKIAQRNHEPQVRDGSAPASWNAVRGEGTHRFGIRQNIQPPTSNTE